MLKWAAIFFVIAIVAAVLGFTGIAAGAAEIAKILFFVFLLVFLVTLIMGLVRVVQPGIDAVSWSFVLVVTMPMRCGLLCCWWRCCGPGRCGGPGCGALRRGGNPRLPAVEHDRWHSHCIGRSSSGWPRRKSGEPHGVPLQGRVAVRRDGGVHSATGLCHAELPPGAARPGICRRHRDLAAASLREVLRQNQVPQGRPGGGDRWDARTAPGRLQRHGHHCGQESCEGSRARPCTWWHSRPSPC